LGLWGVLAFLKPSTGLAAIAFSIPFFWYPKVLGQQHFPLAETLLVLVFGGVLARRLLSFASPSLASRLHIEASQDEPVLTIPDTQIHGAPGGGLIDNWSPTRAPRLLTLDEYHRTVDRPGWVDEKRTEPLPIPSLHIAASDDALQPASWPPRPVAARVGATIYQADATSLPAATVGSPGRNGSHAFAAAEKWQEQARLLPSLEDIKARFLAWQHADPFAPPAAALLLVATFSLLTLADPAFAKDSARLYRWAIVLPVLFYFLITDAIKGRRGLLRVVDFFTVAGVGVAFYGLWQFFVSDNTLVVEGVSRVFSVYQHPNNLALYLGRVLPLTFCLAIFLPWGWRKFLYGLALLPLGATFLLTYSRGAWVAVAVAVLVALGLGLALGRRSGVRLRLSRRVVASALAFLLLLVMGAVVLLPRLPERIVNFESGSMRVLHWQSSLRMIADRPVFGVGIDQFLNQFQARSLIAGPEECVKLFDQHPHHYIVDQAQCKEFYTAHPHNFILDAWLSLGIIGLLVLLWAVWTYFRVALAAIRRLSGSVQADPLSRALTLGLLASMVDFLVHGMVDNSYFLMDLAMIFWLSCGLLKVVIDLKAPEEEQGTVTAS
ncbi:MAG TPA: O-antigen ligase family protein, partial [Chloroflexia bacterium]|nr:O-antigen ligase family protein [Chloroflexia bacterium]